MGIEQAFGFGREAEIIYVGQKADYAPYELKIAELQGAVRAYQESIAELKDLARQNKFLATRNRIIADVMKDTLREFIAQGRTTREEVNAIRVKMENRLPPDELDILNQSF